ncbi:hypothetical protein JOB18_048323 [Solea senegalensis]|uniref:Uncharacterized protein n=1 Tax=Solea senegalensis TaxID=28829 RepID=A0AAV6T2C3_SOLSE|nr:hypothetical protein JOB18_048323 [Solea senegalensis]
MHGNRGGSMFDRAGRGLPPLLIPSPLSVSPSVCGSTLSYAVEETLLFSLIRPLLVRRCVW